MTFSDARLREIINGYICVKEYSGGGHETACFKPYEGDWTQQNSLEYQVRRLSEKRLQEKQRKQEKEQQQQRALGAEERHSLYSEVLSELGVNDLTRQDLHQRGLTDEQIEQNQFRSVVQWQSLGKLYDSRLPGVVRHGKSLAVAGDGYLCPVRDFEGRITALQIRLHDPLYGNRYRWLSTKTATLKLQPENENPLAVFHPNNPAKGIGLAEGVGVKPYLTSQSLDLLILGAAGGQWASSPQLFQKNLEKAYSQVGGEKVINIFPDAGDIRNPSVVRRWRRVTNLLIDWGWKVQFGWWGQVDKTFPDIDELEPQQYSTITYVSVAQFKAFCVKWGGLEPRETPDNVIPLSYDERVANAQKKLRILETPAEIVCDPTKKYLPDLVGRVPTSGLLGIKAPKGSGKSYQIKSIKNYCCGYWEEKVIATDEPELAPQQLNLLEGSDKQQGISKPQVRTERVFHKGLGMKFLSINARIALGREQAIKWEFCWIEDADLEGGNPTLSSASIVENIGEIGLCWDSLGKIFNRDWSNTLVVIDEIELGLNHIATSSTCRDRRLFILFTLEKKLKECLDNGGLAIVADADLSDSSLNYLTAIVPGHVPFIVHHDFKGDPWEIDYYTGKRDIVLSQIEDWLSDENCQPIAIGLDNQSEAESFSNYLIKKYPYLKKKVGGLIRIDSKITQTDFGKEFVKRPNQSIEKFQPKVLIYTSSLGVGTSIEVDWFGRVFGLFFGNIEPSQARQILGRVRLSVPRTVWCKDRGVVSNEISSFLPSEIKRRLFESNQTTTALIDIALHLARERADNPQSDAEILPNLIETLTQMMGPDGTWNNPHLDLYCNEIARRNFSLSQLAVQLRQELIEEGHHLRDIAAVYRTNCGDSVTIGKDEIKRNNATLTANAQDIPFEDAQKIKYKPARTEEEEHAANKAFLKRELPGIELTPEFVYKAVYKDNRRWLNQQKLFWYCFNLEAVKHEDRKEWKAKLRQFNKGVPFLPDIRTYSIKVEAIIKSGVLEWIDPTDLEAEYCCNSPGAQTFLKKAVRNKKLLKAGFNITATFDSDIIYFAKRILEPVGLGLIFSDRDRRRNSDQSRYYKLDPLLACDPDRELVQTALNTRWKIELDKIAQFQLEQELRCVQAEDNFLYNNVQSGRSSSQNQLAENLVVNYTTSLATQFDDFDKKPDEIDLKISEKNELDEIVKSQSEQELRCVQTDDNFLYNNVQSGRINNQDELAENLVLNNATNVPAQSGLNQWTESSITEVAQMLLLCEDAITLSLLRQCEIPSNIFKLATRQLAYAKRQQIRQWVISGNGTTS